MYHKALLKQLGLTRKPAGVNRGSRLTDLLYLQNDRRGPELFSCRLGAQVRLSTRLDLLD